MCAAVLYGMTLYNTELLCLFGCSGLYAWHWLEFGAVDMGNYGCAGLEKIGLDGWTDESHES